ncbi:hypothetical protein KR093_008920, partial [Drosophila rubida]
MPLKAVCIELRPNLCSGHVFLQFEHDLCDNNKTRVVIKEHDVHIVEDADNAPSELVIRHATYSMDIQQISMFTASSQNISFRFNYTRIDLDALHKAGNLQVESKPQPLLLNFAERQDALSLRCSNCQFELVASCCYNRLREFPSGLIDPSEFFCHNHHGDTSKQDQHQHQQPSLVPGPSDMYYGLNHIVLNIAVLQNSVINSSDYLYCKRCMRMLGHLILEGAAAKLWADALRWLPSDAQETPPTSPVPRQLFQHSTVTQLMLRLLSSLWMQSQPRFGIGSSCRALLVTTKPDRRQHYMLIQVLERQLAVLRRLPKAAGTALQQLHYLRACKLYFRVYDSREVESDLLQQQQQQLELPTLNISPYLFAELQARMTRNSQLIPKAWRHNTAEEQLLLTYFFYEQEQE